MKILFKLAITKRAVFYLKMHQKSFVGRAPPRPAGGAYSAPPDPLAGFKGPTPKEGDACRSSGHCCDKLYTG